MEPERDAGLVGIPPAGAGTTPELAEGCTRIPGQGTDRLGELRYDLHPRVGVGPVNGQRIRTIRVHFGLANAVRIPREDVLYGADRLFVHPPRRIMPLEKTSDAVNDFISDATDLRIDVSTLDQW